MEIKVFEQCPQVLISYVGVRKNNPKLENSFIIEGTESSCEY
jgi:hypothetical protein